MIGRSFRGRILMRTRVREKENREKIEAPDLVERFQKLSFEAPHTIPVQDVGKGIFFLQKREYWKRATYPKKQQRDYLHLNEQGVIKKEILAIRQDFLKQHGLLQDKFKYEGRLVYGNFHLYDTEQKDIYGLTNLQRMSKGLCPINKVGKSLIIIHHFDQTMDGPWIILSDEFHCKFSKDLHSEVRVSGAVNQQFEEQRRAYWKYEAHKRQIHTVRPKK